jgi:hypothetical protein
MREPLLPYSSVNGPVIARFARGSRYVANGFDDAADTSADATPPSTAAAAPDQDTQPPALHYMPIDGRAPVGVGSTATATFSVGGAFGTDTKPPTIGQKLASGMDTPSTPSGDQGVSGFRYTPNADRSAASRPKVSVMVIKGNPDLPPAPLTDQPQAPPSPATVPVGFGTFGRPDPAPPVISPVSSDNDATSPPAPIGQPAPATDTSSSSLAPSPSVAADSASGPIPAAAVAPSLAAGAMNRRTSRTLAALAARIADQSSSFDDPPGTTTVEDFAVSNLATAKPDALDARSISLLLPIIVVDQPADALDPNQSIYIDYPRRQFTGLGWLLINLTVPRLIFLGVLSTAFMIVVVMIRQMRRRPV